ncbi:LLM class flavin-dependent oxidoreductase [Nonomuraea sp. NPDC050663]|uniref:LLM class flavin-dependent oxidoreductase n=1 Tax=Nonomuraea sp. NPDC050663 TaxID=3364370 RepID=UPI0037B85D85
MLRRAFKGEPFDYRGDYYTLEGGGLAEPIAPEIYFGGASPAAEQVAARRVDVALMWGEPPSAIAERVKRLRDLAAERPLRFGVRLHVIARDTSEEAWAEADRLLSGMDPARIAKAQERFARFDSVGQRRMVDLHGGGQARDLEIHPGLWAGVGLVREGAGTALVGSYAEVAELIRQYAAAGAEEFILSGWPHLEEALRVGDFVLPRLVGLEGVNRS